jgi:hypothetical protein
MRCSTFDRPGIMRFAVVLLLVLAACQPNRTQIPSDNADPAITPEYVAALPPEQSRPAVSRLANEVIAMHSRACGAAPETEWGACMNLRMLQSFDRYGFLAQHCRGQPDNKAFRACIFSSRSAIDWTLAVGGNPDTDLDWSKPEQANEQALKKLNDVLTKACGGKPELPGDSCFTRESAKRLGLSAMVATHCSARKEMEQRGACIVDAHDAAMYQAALSALKP